MRQWLADHPGEAARLASLNAATARPQPASSSPIDVDAAWRRAATRLEPAVPGVRSIESRRSKRTEFAVPSLWRSPALRAAAAMLAVAGTLLVLKYAGVRPPEATTVVAARTFATAPGQRDSVVLSDGTGVLLGPGSSLRVDEGYGSQRRDVHLDGEALFDVRHDAARPFVVHATGVVVRDLGTTFSVLAPSDPRATATVAVTSGSVRLSRGQTTPDSGIVLHQGDVGTVPPTGDMVVHRGVSVDAELAWTRDSLVFHDTPVPTIASALRRWYGVDVEIRDPALNTRTFVASFPKGTPLAVVLKVLGTGLQTNIQQQGSVVVIGAGGGRGTLPE
jgi:transmembrane sensor